MKTTERRSRTRFPLAEVVRYRIPARRLRGVGRTVNLSNSGVLLEVEHHLMPGEQVEISMEWPSLPEGEIRLQLVAHGQVVRIENTRVAIRLDTHQFRTRTGVSRAD